MEKWKCTVCGYVHEGPMAEDFKCPLCKQGTDKFVKMEEEPAQEEKKVSVAANNGPKFYICRHCGNIIGMIKDAGVPIKCCGEKMEELVANTVDASGEKHIPVVEVADGMVKVTVGSVEHPMLPEHSIEWIYLQTEKGGQRKVLNPGEAPAAAFALGDDKPVAVYEYCNLHGLWMTKL